MKKFIFKGFIFAVIFCSILFYVDHYFVKDQHIFLKHHFFYDQDKNSIDLLVLGDSHAYCGVSSDVIEAKTGLNAYNHGIGGVNFIEIYYNLIEALKYQNPKLIVIENYPFIGVGQEKTTLGEDGLLNRRTVFSLEGKKVGLTKIQEAYASYEDYPFLNTFNIFKYHENWSDLEDVSKVLYKYSSNKEFPPVKDSAKDIVFMSQEIADGFSNKNFNDAIYISDDHKQIIKDIMALSIENKFEVLFVTVPFYKDYYLKMKEKFDVAHKDLAEIIKPYGNAKLFDINKEVVLNSSNFLGGSNAKTFNYNNQHLNYKGNIKTSNLIANFINNNYALEKVKNKSATVQDAFYNYSELNDTKNVQGEILTINGLSVNSPSNLIRKHKDFDDSIWSKGSTIVKENTVAAPDGSLTADHISGSGEQDGYILQAISNKEGEFSWSVWLKGTGTTRLRLQEEGGDYTNYETLNITLTPEWEKYTLVCAKENDNHGIRGVISGIQTSDSFYLWEAELIFTSQNDEKEKPIIISENEKNINISGWMFVKGEKVENKFVALKKDEEFSYISLLNQVKNVKNDIIVDKYGENYNDSGYSFQIPTDILEKGEYEVFHIARNAKNEFYTQKVKGKMIIN